MRQITNFLITKLGYSKQSKFIGTLGETSMETFIQTRNFIYKNARPLDRARWDYLFEDASSQNVLACLSTFQNPDGGFAHALEPDCWNVNSTPLQTWVATRILKEVHLDDKNHPLIQGILRYLLSGHEFNGHIWNGLNTVPSNNDYPHAPWWSFTKTHETSYNPTASLTGFMLKYANNDSSSYGLACSIAKEAYIDLKKRFPLESMHEVACYVELYEYLKECNITQVIDLDEFKGLLHQQVDTILTRKTDTWNTDYVCKPSLFIKNKASDFYLGNKEICAFELEFIRQTQRTDGTWDVAWSWDDYPEQWAISKNWWKSDIIIKNCAFVKAFESE